MIIKLGSLLKIIYAPEVYGGGWQTGVITRPTDAIVTDPDRQTKWFLITHLTPVVGGNERVPSWLGVGHCSPWYAPSCLGYFTPEVLEEGGGDEIVLGSLETYMLGPK